MEIKGPCGLGEAEEDPGKGTAVLTAKESGLRSITFSLPTLSPTLSVPPPWPTGSLSVDLPNLLFLPLSR